MKPFAKPYDLVIVWRVTDYCNLDCGFCAHANTLTRRRTSVAEDEAMSFGQLLHGYKKETGHNILVNFLGGEPLYWKHLRATATAFKKWGMDISATTNGVPLQKPDLQQAIVNQFSQLTVSVDGFAAFHDKNRGKEGLFEAVAANTKTLADLRTARDKGLYLRANVVLARENFDMFPDLCRTVAGWGVNEITYNQVGGRDRPENFAHYKLSPEHIDRLEKILPPLRLQMEAQGVHINTNPDYLRRFKAYAEGKSLYVKDCAPGRNFLFVDEDCRIAPCNFTTDSYGVPLRSIETVKTFRELPEHFADLQRTRHHMACKDCMSTRVSGKFIPK